MAATTKPCKVLLLRIETYKGATILDSDLEQHLDGEEFHDVVHVIPDEFRVDHQKPERFFDVWNREIDETVDAVRKHYPGWKIVIFAQAPSAIMMRLGMLMKNWRDLVFMNFNYITKNIDVYEHHGSEKLDQGISKFASQFTSTDCDAKDKESALFFSFNNLHSFSRLLLPAELVGCVSSISTFKPISDDPVDYSNIPLLDLGQRFKQVLDRTMSLYHNRGIIVASALPLPHCFELGRFLNTNIYRSITLVEMVQGNYVIAWKSS